MCSTNTLLTQRHSENCQGKGVENTTMENYQHQTHELNLVTYNSTAPRPAAVPAKATPAWYLLTLLLTTVRLANPMSSGR